MNNKNKLGFLLCIFGLMTVLPGYAQTAFTADGVVESKAGGFQFPDGTVQITSAESGGPYTSLDVFWFFGPIGDSLSLTWILAGPGEYRLIEQIFVSVSNDAEVAIIICWGDCATQFYRLATVTKGFHQLTFDRPILAERVQVLCSNPPAGETNCRINASALLKPE